VAPAISRFIAFFALPVNGRSDRISNEGLLVNINFHFFIDFYNNLVKVQPLRTVAVFILRVKQRCVNGISVLYYMMYAWYTSHAF